MLKYLSESSVWKEEGAWHFYTKQDYPITPHNQNPDKIK